MQYSVHNKIQFVTFSLPSFDLKQQYQYDSIIHIKCYIFIVLFLLDLVVFYTKPFSFIYINIYIHLHFHIKCFPYGFCPNLYIVFPLNLYCSIDIISNCIFDSIQESRDFDLIIKQYQENLHS